MTDQLEATADAIGFSVKVTKAGWFGSKADMYFTWDALEIFKIVGGKSPNLTMRWVNGSTHSYTGADKDALYAYLKANFPKREHAGWW
jgi:hypothetical protein